MYTSPAPSSPPRPISSSSTQEHSSSTIKSGSQQAAPPQQARRHHKGTQTFLEERNIDARIALGRRTRSEAEIRKQKIRSFMDRKIRQEYIRDQVTCTILDALEENEHELIGKIKTIFVDHDREQMKALIAQRNFDVLHREENESSHPSIPNFPLHESIESESSLQATKAKLITYLKLFHDQSINQPPSEETKEILEEAHLFIRELDPGQLDQTTRLLVARLCGVIIERSSEDGRKAMLPEIIRQIESNDFFPGAAELIFHRHVFVPIILKGSDAELKTSLIQALEKAKEKNSVCKPEDARYRIVLSSPGNFMEMLHIVEWEEEQDPSQLGEVLKQITQRSYPHSYAVLKFFYLFIHAHDDAAKLQIAKTVAHRQESLFDELALKRGQYLITKEMILSEIALASMVSYYLLSGEKENGYLAKNIKKTSETYGRVSVPKILRDIGNNLRYPFKETSNPEFYEDSEYTGEDRLQILACSLEGMDLAADLLTEDSFEKLCDNEADRTKTAVGNWCLLMSEWLGQAKNIEPPEEFLLAQKALQECAGKALRHLDEQRAATQ